MSYQYLPPLPGCGMPAVAQFDLYSPGVESLHGSLDGSLYVCSDHADPNALVAATAGFLTPHRMARPRAEGKRCGDGFDHLAKRPLLAPEIDLAQTDPVMEIGNRVLHMLAGGYGVEHLARIDVSIEQAETALDAYVSRILHGSAPPMPSTECSGDPRDGLCHVHGVYHPERAS